ICHSPPFAIVNRPRMQVHVRTTQNVFITYPVASVGDRILAYLLDQLILVVFVIVMIAFYYNVKMEITWIWIVTVGAPYILYHVMFEIFMNGQSPGKRVLNIRVLRLDGTPASVGNYVLRWMFAFIDIQLMSGLIAILVIAIGEKGQRLGDLVAGTTVVKLIPESQVSAANVFVPTQNPDYSPVFPEVVSLSERDIELIQRALEVNRDSGNVQPVMAVTEKIRSLLNIQTDLPPVKFLYTIVKDFQHLTSK
ncbi:MAG TPA: RDD family protein, partial [Cyclobacteriaceae bacterium]|nr:RDD family protein [Cyclobacteriaceae bacterium]